MDTNVMKAGAMGIAAALPLVLVVYLVADAVSGPLLVTQPGDDVAEEVPVGAALGFTALGGVVGIGLALVVARRWSASTFVKICVVGLALYAVMPFVSAEEVATAIWLNVMHVAAAVPIVGLLARAIEQHHERDGSRVAATQGANP